MIKRLVVCLLISVFLLTPVLWIMVTNAYAADEFATSYDVTYDVTEDGITTVTEKITLRNLTSQFYATEFKLTIGSTEIFDVKGSDPAGPMEVTTEKQQTSTIITVKFNQQVAGLNKQFPWTLQFKSRDFAQKQGKVWEVSIPKISTSTNVENYKLTLSVPSSFENPSVVSPRPVSQTTSFGKKILTFDKEQLFHAGVSVLFGNSQLYNFDLNYNLENTNLMPVLTNIALPPDTAYQDVIFHRIDPAPVNVTVDEDGNYLAWYRLQRGDRFTVKVVGSAKLYTSSKAVNPNLPVELRTKYIQADKYWERDNPQIINKLPEILGSDPKNLSNSEKAERIYRYVVEYLKYDSSRIKNSGIERFGALVALNNPTKAVCMEFTDLFITLARAANIPARELNGYGNTSNSTLRPLSLSRDILHSWPEYWDEGKGWVMVDPTWENTTGGVDYFNKLDLNHFVFAVKGVSSEQPVPAGSYKYTNDDNSQDVKVSLSDVDFLGKSQLEVTIDSDSILRSGFPEKLKVTVKNYGNSLQASIPFGIKARGVNIFNETQTKQLGPVPAFGKAEFEFDIRTKSFFDNFDDTIEVTVGGQRYTKEVSVRPFFIFQLYPYGLIAIVAAITAIYLLVLGGLIYRRKFAKTATPPSDVK